MQAHGAKTLGQACHGSSWLAAKEAEGTGVETNQWQGRATARMANLRTWSKPHRNQRRLIAGPPGPGTCERMNTHPSDPAWTQWMHTNRRGSRPTKPVSAMDLHKVFP